MKAFLALVRAAVVLLLALTLLVGTLHTLSLWGASHVIAPERAEGSLIVRDGKVIGSQLLAQRFTQDRYFHPRPSAAGQGYDPLASGGSNMGPENEKLRASVRELTAEYRRENGLGAADIVPADAVTRSGSGLDPDISVENARLQAARVARARDMSDASVRALVEHHIEQRTAGIFGEPRVNVLVLNLALDGGLR